MFNWVELSEFVLRAQDLVVKYLLVVLFLDSLGVFSLPSRQLCIKCRVAAPHPSLVHLVLRTCCPDATVGELILLQFSLHMDFHRLNSNNDATERLPYFGFGF